MKLNRSIEAWDKCDAGAMSKMSEAAIKYAFADAKQDIKQMAAIQEQLVAALSHPALYELLGNVEDSMDSSTWSKAVVFMEARDAALAAAGAQP